MGNYLPTGLTGADNTKSADNSNTASPAQPNASHPTKAAMSSNVNRNADALLSLLGNTFVTNDGLGDKTFAKAIAPNSVIALYFSAGWCGPCRQFTPRLQQIYAEWKRQNKKVEVVFVSGDRSYEAFKDYFGSHHGKWLALPFGSAQLKNVSRQFAVRGIPAVIFVDAFGNVIERDGRALLQRRGAQCIDVLMQNLPEPGPAKGFGGTAHSLQSAPSDGAAISMYDYIAGKELTVSANVQAQSVSMQIMLANGKKHSVKVSETQTVGEVFAHAKALHDPGRFQLLSGFPPKVLTDETMSVVDAGLKGARVTQKKM